MSCCGGYCTCGDDCICGDDCNCVSGGAVGYNMFPGLVSAEKKTSTPTEPLILGVALEKGSFEGFDMGTSGSENGCTCNPCKCNPCTCK